MIVKMELETPEGTTEETRNLNTKEFNTMYRTARWQEIRVIAITVYSKLKEPFRIELT